MRGSSANEVHIALVLHGCAVQVEGRVKPLRFVLTV